VTRHADILAVERQHDRFWNTSRAVLQSDAVEARAQASGVDIKTLIHMDGDEHRATRKITNDWFRPTSLRQNLEREIARLARRYVDRMQELGGACDFSADVALYYPLHVIMSVLGVPESDEPRMLRLTQQLFGAEDPDFGGPDGEQAQLAALMDFYTYFNHIPVDRRERPTNDIASTIANARLDDLASVSYYVIIATAGHDTTSSSLAGGLEALVRSPEQLRALRDDPALIDNAADEMIRWVTPVRHFMRYAQEDATVGSTRIRKGERLLLAYLSGNRDESVFPDPFRFDVRRVNAEDHVAFGIGVHFCLGAHLARMELRAFFRELLPRLESIELAGEPEYTATTFVGGPKRVPIRYRLRAGAR
jgi:cytochrome P450